MASTRLSEFDHASRPGKPKSRPDARAAYLRVARFTDCSCHQGPSGTLWAYKQQSGGWTGERTSHPVEFACAQRGVLDLRVPTVLKIARGFEIEPARLIDGLGSQYGAAHSLHPVITDRCALSLAEAA